jgi:hypothetical protein
MGTLRSRYARCWRAIRISISRIWWQERFIPNSETSQRPFVNFSVRLTG